MDSTFWTAVGAIATAIAALVAIWTLFALRADSKDRTRPIVVATLQPSILTRNYEFHVANLGQSVAKKVKVTFEPPLPLLPGSLDDNIDQFATWSLQRRYARVIPTLAPGQVLDNLYQDARDKDEPVPDSFAVVVTYIDDRNRKYVDTYELSTEVLSLQTGSYPSTDSDTGRQKRLVAAIESIARGIGRA
ncbi:MAG: hypothetical protein QM774_11160 [Gordonia sp. (in: high G+C Gram-positive bacteria)]|uniref:hypothetical protein n=1 Tax=Gordonia sp. (in: high G+C Gram-positive bacteria) TaxID=84139 RepID=UPI0039E599A2